MTREADSSMRVVLCPRRCCNQGASVINDACTYNPFSDVMSENRLLDSWVRLLPSKALRICGARSVCYPGQSLRHPSLRGTWQSCEISILACQQHACEYLQYIHNGQTIKYADVQAREPNTVQGSAQCMRTSQVIVITGECQCATT